MEAISLSRAEGFIEPYLKGIEAATKMELRFSVTKEKKKKAQTSVLLMWCDKQKPRGLILMNASYCLLQFNIRLSNFQFQISVWGLLTQSYTVHRIENILTGNTVSIAQTHGTFTSLKNKNLASRFALFCLQNIKPSRWFAVRKGGGGESLKNTWFILSFSESNSFI